jgi:hypothetical protein
MVESTIRAGSQSRAWMPDKSEEKYAATRPETATPPARQPVVIGSINLWYKTVSMSNDAPSLPMHSG